MPVRPNPNNDQTETHKRIKILQINLNKSEKAHLDIMNDKVSLNYDVILIQEPHTTAFNAIRTPANFRPVYPKNRLQDEAQIRSVIWISKRLDTKDWIILDIPETNDITAIQLKGQYGTLAIFNIYNDCRHSRNEVTLRQYIHRHSNTLLDSENHHMIWAGDFNRHHPLWDRDEDTHLFTTQATRKAEDLISLLAEYNMVMSLPKGAPTLQHMRSKRYSRPDNVFCTPSLSELIYKCEVLPELRPTLTDHFPIETVILLPQDQTTSAPAFNFRETDWDKFRQNLLPRLQPATDEQDITNPDQLNEAILHLTTALQATIQATVTKSKPRPDAKRWWNGDLRRAKKELNRLRATSYKNRALINHPSHSELKTKSNQYGDAIIHAKRQHWASYLEDMSANDIWTANKFIKEPAGDGGSPRIPTLTTKDDTGADTHISDNKDKAATFAKVFFPPPPETDDELENFEYPEPLPDPSQITLGQVQRHIAKLSPYKAHGPDDIPNVVLQKCSDIISRRLLTIFQAILDLNVYYDPWREFTTIVLRKPNKPNYEIPKAYRPIALLSTTAKVLTSIIAEKISTLIERHQLLPKTHFGGRPGRSTSDAIQYLVHKIKTAWREDKVASVLFLDVEGAFPNAATARLIHNLKKRRIPTTIVKFVAQLLANRKTRIKFDDYTSEIINIENGIGQGDPLSMILYIIYNADLLDLPDDPLNEDALGYVDDMALVAIGKDFEETTQRLKTMMTKDQGGLQWSREHNSRFEVNKSAILHLTRRTAPDPDSNHRRIPLEKPVLELEGLAVQEVESFKYLGVQIDAQLRWKEQTQRAIANATKWLLQFRRLTKISTGVNAKLMRQLYLAVALPKITYGIDIWYSPPTKPAGYTKNIGSVNALRQLQKTQRIATLAITGSLRTSPNDLLDVHAGLLPMDLALLKACHNAMVRMLTLPNTHPLHRIIKHAKRHPPDKHTSPIDQLLKTLGLIGTNMETIYPCLGKDDAPNIFSTETAKTREVSINLERNDKADYRIYSDGSGHSGGIGAAAILYKKGQARPLKSLQVYLGPVEKHTTYKAETAGGILATWILSNTPETIGKKVSLYVDNQAFITAIEGTKSTSGQHLIKTFKTNANSLGCRLNVTWISSHSGVKGNEEVDKIAKRAAEGRSSRTADLPHIFRNPLPTSASATKQHFNETIKQRWETNWNLSPRKIRIDRIDRDFPYKEFRKRSYMLTRKQTSIIMQLRSGHIPLNVYLHRIGRAGSDTCMECYETQEEESIPETINHFVFECTAHKKYRDDLVKETGRSRFNLRSIMKNTDYMKALVKFINRTERLKA